MKPLDQPQALPEPSFTFTARKSTRNALIAKLVTVVGLSIWFTWFFWSTSTKQYESGQRLTVKTHLEKFEEHKGELLANRTYAENLGLTALASLIVIGFMFSSYELIALGISLFIGKFTRP